MASLWEKIARVRPGIWFAFAVLLTVAGYVGSADILWSILWLAPHLVLLVAVWQGSRAAWAILVVVSVSLAIALAVVSAGMLFSAGFVMNIYWWGPTAHGLALLCLVVFRASRRHVETHQHHIA